MIVRVVLVVGLAWLSIGISTARAEAAVQTPEERGLAIALEAQERDRGYLDTTAEMTMLLTNAEGRRRIRRLTWQTLEVDEPGEGDKSLTIFHEPRDIAGTAFLSHTHTDRNDDQWIYLPSLKRVKRIASANKSSAFMGSEFAYEDLLSDEIERFDYLWLNDAPCGEWQCFVLERRPRYAGSGYTKQILWLDQSEYRPAKIEYYDRKVRLQKTLEFHDYRLYLDRFWRAHELRMANHQTEKTTVLTFAVLQMQSGLGADDFNPAMLRRLR